MELAVSTYSLSRWRRENNKTLENSLDWIAGAGVKAVEFALLDDKAKDNPVGRARSLRKRCEKLGLKVVSYCTGAELYVPPHEQAKVVETLKREVDVAAELGVASMRHDVTRGPRAPQGKKDWKKPSVKQIIDAIVPAIREVTEYGQSLGIKTSLENHGYYMQPAETVEKLLKAVDHPNFALTMDMGNFLVVNQDPIEAVRRLAKYAIMVHAKDFHQRPKKQMPPSGWFATPSTIALRGAICGHGVLDLPAQLKILRKAGYDGYLSLEFEGMEEPTKAVTLGLEYLRSVLN